MESLKNIIENHNKDVVFPLFGGAVTVSAQRNIYNAMRRKYRSMVPAAIEKFKEIAQFKDAEDMDNNVKDTFMTAIDEMSKQISLDAISMDIYNLDTKSILKECFNDWRFHAFVTACDDLSKEVKEAVKQRQRDGYVADIKTDMTKSISGHDYAYKPTMQVDSIGDAIAIEIGAAIGGSLLDWSDRKETERARASAEKSATKKYNSTLGRILNDKKKEVLKGAQRACYNLAREAITIISDKGKLEFNGSPSSSDDKEAESIINNLKELDLPLNKQHEFAIKIISLDPYMWGYYKDIASKLGVSNGELYTLSEYFGVDDFRFEVLEQIISDNKSLIDSNPNAFRELIENKSVELGMTDENIESAKTLVTEAKVEIFSAFIIEGEGIARIYTDPKPYLESIEEKRIHLGLDKNQRGEVYEIVEEAKIEALTLYADNCVKHNMGTSEADAHKCRELITMKAADLELSTEGCESAYKTIDDRLVKLDLEYRTVDKVVLETRELADLAREELSKINEIMTNVKKPELEAFLPYEVEILAKKEQISQFTTAVKDKYIKQLDKYLKDFEFNFLSVSIFKQAKTRHEAAQARAFQLVKKLKPKTLDEISDAKTKLLEFLPLVGITENDAHEAFNYLDETQQRIDSGKKQQTVAGEALDGLASGVKGLFGKFKK